MTLFYCVLRVTKETIQERNPTKSLSHKEFDTNRINQPKEQIQRITKENFTKCPITNIKERQTLTTN